MKKIVYLSMITAMAGFNFFVNGMQSHESDSSLSQSESASALSLSSSARSLVAEAARDAITQAYEAEIAGQQQQAADMGSLALKNAGGHSCFLNSVMQAIYVCPRIRHLIEMCGEGHSLIGSVQHFLTAMTPRPGVVSPVETGDRTESGLTHDVLQYIPVGRGENMAQDNQDGDALEVVEQIVSRLLDVVGIAPHKLSIVLTDQDNSRGVSLQDLLYDGLLGNRYMYGIDDLQDLVSGENPPASLFVDVVRGENRCYMIPNNRLEVPTFDDNLIEYALRSVVVHTGTHYYTYQRVGEQWYKKNDEMSVLVNDDAAVRDMQENGCICFYEKVALLRKSKMAF